MRHLLLRVSLHGYSCIMITCMFLLLCVNSSNADTTLEWIYDADGTAILVMKPRSKAKKRSRTKRKKNKIKAKQGLSALPPSAEPFRAFVQEAARTYDLPEAFIWGVMKVESGFNPKAVSDKGAEGLMQLMPFTAKELGVKDSFDPKQNIMGAALLLRRLLDRFNNEKALALSAYHAGAGAVVKARGIPFSETAQYVKMTLNAYWQYLDDPPF